MLESLGLKNFKAWRGISEMRLAPITGLFGTNSSGKSSILQFLLMLKQTADSPDRQQVFSLGEEKSEKSLTILGTFEDVLCKQSADRAIECALKWNLPEPLKVIDPDDPRSVPKLEGDRIEYSVRVAKDEASPPHVEELSYRFANHRFTMKCSPDSAGTPSRRYQVHDEGNSFRLARIQGRPPEGFSPPVKCYGFPDDVRAAYKNAGVLSDIEFEFERQMQRTYYLGPLREFPYRDYRWSGAEPVDMGRRGEKFIPALLAAKQQGVMIGRGRGRKSLEAWVASWLQKLGLIHAFKVTEINKNKNLYEVRVQRSQDSPEVLLPDVGFGVSQVLPVIVLCYYVPPGSTILLEQPEIHLHPSVQRGLADVFIDAVKTRDVQIIVESHSEWLLRRLQRRVAEEILKPNQAALYFCEAANGVSSVRALDLDLLGNIQNWPRDFFGDEMEDIVATTRAARKRRDEPGP